MEDLYFLISDCIHNLSNLFSIHSLLELSATNKYNSKLIYELKLHDHITQPIYYTSTNQIKLFRNINTLNIPRYISYNNLSQLTHINNVIFSNTWIITQITKLTNLISLIEVDMYGDEIEFRPYFHTNLKNLYDYESNSYDFSIEHNHITKFTRLTSLDVYQFNTCTDVEQLLIFNNLKSLKTDVLENMSMLSRLKSLCDLSIHSEFYNESFSVTHSHITRIKIEVSKNFSILQCFNLKKLEVNHCGIIHLSIFTDLRTLIISTLHSKFETKFNFDINQCVNLEYFECHGKILNTNFLHLHKLNQLALFHNSIEIHPSTASNLTYLYIFGYLKIFDLSFCVNLKKLIIFSSQYININNVNKLESLEVYNNFHHECINGSNFANLTHLHGTNCSHCNLHVLTKLKMLTLINIDESELIKIWDHNIPYMSNLTYLSLYAFDSANEKTMNTHYLSNCKLKYLACNFKLNDLNKLTMLNHLKTILNKKTPDTITKLTRLTNIDIFAKDHEFSLDLKNLTRLNLAYDENITLPELKIIE